MSSRVKGLLACSIAIVLLVGGLVTLLLMGEGDEGNSSSEIIKQSAIYENDVDDVDSVEVKNDEFSYTVVKDDDGFTLEGYEKFPLEEALVLSNGQNLASLTPLVNVEDEASDLAKYGLEEPRATVSVSFADNTVQDVVIGDDAPLGSGTYVCLKDSKTVYTVSTDIVSVYVQPRDAFISKVVVPKPVDNDYPILNEVIVHQAGDVPDIKFEYSEGEVATGTLPTHNVVEPVFAYTEASKSTDYTHSIYGLTAYSIVKLNPTEEDLKAVGLDQPICTVTIKTDDEDYILNIGNQHEDAESGAKLPYYYGYFEGVDILYVYEKENLPWVGMKVTDVTSGKILGTNFYDISKLTVNASDIENVYECEGKGDEFTAKLNGEDVDGDIAINMYKFILQAPALDICLEEPKGEAIASVTMERHDGEEGETLEFFELDSRNVAIKLNGKVSFMCRASYVERLESNLVLSREGKELVTTWE